MAETQSKRLVRLWNEEVSAYEMKKLVEALSKLADEDSDAPILFEIYSNGGNCEAGFAFCDWVAANNIPLNTVGYGQVSSMAIPIFLLGKQRSMGARCTMTLHPMQSVFTEKKSLEGTALAEQITQLKDWQAIYLDHVVHHVHGIDRKELKKMMDKNTTFNAERALKLGLVDNVFS